MRKSILLLLAAVFIVSILAPVQTVYAQISFPAEINKDFLPNTIASGGVSVLSVTIYNPNPFQLTNASWTDNMPTGMTVVGVPANPQCGGTVTVGPGSTSFSLSGGIVPAQFGITPGSCTVSVNVTSTTTGNRINTIPAGELTSTGGGTTITNTTPASATLNVTGVQAPTVSKSFNPGTIWVGGTSQLSIVIRNNHPSTTLTQARLTDTLPANVFLANPPNVATTGCGSPTFSPSPAAGDTSISITNGTIAPNSTCTITVNVTSNVQGAYTNRIPANSLRTFENLTNATQATARLNVDAIGLTKRFSPPTFSAGGTTTLIITLQNPTASPYTGAAVTDNLPSPLTVAGAASSTCVPPGTVSTTATSVTLAGGTIPAGSITTPGTCTISVQVTVPLGTPSGALTNTIPPGGLTTDQVPTGNPRRANANVTISGTDVSGTKSFSPASIAAGGNSRLRIVIFAPSDTNLTNFSITDNLPAGVAVSNSTPPAVSGCGPSASLNAGTGANFISLTNGLILTGTPCRIDVFVTSSTLGVHTNTILPANITYTEPRVPPGNLTANLTVTSGGGGNLSIDIVKDFDPLTVFGGSASTMSVQLINPGNVALTGIAFTDTMPGGMILANPVNFNVGTCGGTLSALGGDAFSFSGGSLPAFGTCTLTLSATMTVNGNLTNTILQGAVTTNERATNADPTSASLTNLPGASVSKFFSPNPIAAGSYSTLTITIQNTGNIALTGMRLSDTLPGTLPSGLEVAGPPAPAPVNNCGGTFTAVTGTQFVELTNGSLAGNSSCTILVSITGSNPGDYINTIPAGALITDPSVSVTNLVPATAMLTITGNPGGGGTGGNNPSPNPSTANAFLIPVTGFEQGVVTDLSPAPNLSYYSATSISLEIPSLSVNIPIVGVPKKDGAWNVSWLGNQAGWLEGSAFPSWNGNSVLTSHVYLSNGKPGPFVKLHELKFGDQIIVHAYGQKYIFEVRANAIVPPNDKSVMKHEERPWLTLVTCTDYDEKTGTYKNRFIVRAILMKVSEDR